MGELFDTEPLFPGDDEIQTIYLIQKVRYISLLKFTKLKLLGKLTKEQK